MKANELRIGNAVENNGKIMFVAGLPIIPGEHEVIELAVTHELAISRLDQFSVTLGSVNPVLLTEEWLLKVGFVRKEDGFMPEFELRIDEDHYLYLRIDDLEKSIAQSGISCDDEHHLCIDIECLHTLQNLYFAIVGEELEVRP